MRIIIAGVPKAGKTTLAAELSKKLEIPLVRHTDELVEKFSWSDCSDEVSRWFDETYTVNRTGSFSHDWIIEGCTCARALRKWYRRHDDPVDVKPADFVIHLRTPLVKLEPRAAGMAHGCLRVWNEIRVKLVEHSVPNFDLWHDAIDAEAFRDRDAFSKNGLVEAIRAEMSRLGIPQ